MKKEVKGVRKGNSCGGDMELCSSASRVTCSPGTSPSSEDSPERILEESSVCRALEPHA